MPHYMTRRTLAQLNAETGRLERRVREQSQIVREAIDSGGGTHDNGMYDAALHEQAVLAERLDRAQQYLRDAALIEELTVASDTVTLGKFVVVQNTSTGERTPYIVVGAADVEYEPMQGRISHASPLARQLLGKRLGDVVSITVPGGTYEAEIVELRHCLGAAGK